MFCGQRLQDSWRSLYIINFVALVLLIHGRWKKSPLKFLNSRVVFDPVVDVLLDLAVVLEFFLPFYEVEAME